MEPFDTMHWSRGEVRLSAWTAAAHRALQGPPSGWRMGAAVGLSKSTPFADGLQDSTASKLPIESYQRKCYSMEKLSSDPVMAQRDRGTPKG